MAQLTERDQAALKAKGGWVKERCDRVGCTHIIGPLSWRGREGQVYCSSECQDLVEPRVRKYKKKPEATESGSNGKPNLNGAGKVLGIAKAGTTLANVLTALLDGAWHTKDSLEKCQVKPAVSIGWRLTLLQH